MRNLLVVAYYFPPCGGGGVVRVKSFVRYLRDNGWRPLVLTVKEKYYPAFLRDYSSLDGVDQGDIFRTNSFELAGKVNDKLYSSFSGISNVPGYYSSLKTVLKKIYHSIFIPDEKLLWLPFALIEGIRINHNYEPDMIYVTLPPHSSAVIGFVLGKILRKPLILDFRDDWVGNPYYNSELRWRNALAAKLEKVIVESAELIISVTEESKSLFLRKYPNLPESKFVVIPNGFDPGDLHKFRNGYGFSSRTRDYIRVIYTGGLWRKRSPVALFEALNIIRRQNGNIPIKLDFYGPYVDEYRQLACNMNLTDMIRFHGNIDREKVLMEIHDSDVGLVIIPKEEGGSTAIPGKVYEYLALKKYVLALCPIDSALASLVNRFQLGSVVPMDDSNAIAEAIKRILLLHKNGRLVFNDSNGLLQFFDRSYHAKILAEHLNLICSK